LGDKYTPLECSAWDKYRGLHVNQEFWNIHDHDPDEDKRKNLRDYALKLGLKRPKETCGCEECIADREPARD